MFFLFPFCNLTDIYFLDRKQKWGTGERAGEGDDTGRRRSGLKTETRPQVTFFSFFFILLTFIIYRLRAATTAIHHHNTTSAITIYNDDDYLAR